MRVKRKFSGGLVAHVRLNNYGRGPGSIPGARTLRGFMVLAMIIITLICAKTPEVPHEEMHVNDMPEFYRGFILTVIALIAIGISLADYMIWRIIFNPIVY